MGVSKVFYILIPLSLSLTTQSYAQSFERVAGDALRRHLKSSAFTNLTMQARGASKGAAAYNHIQPWSLESTYTNFTNRESAQSDTSAVQDGYDQLTIELSKYLGHGLTFSSSAELTGTSYFEVLDTEIDDTVATEFTTSLSVDLWRDRFGRYDENQRMANMNSEKASQAQALDGLEQRAYAFLELLVDLCVEQARKQSLEALKEQQRSILRLVRGKVRAGTAAKSELLQLENLFLDFDRQIVQFNQAITSFNETLETIYSFESPGRACSSFASSGNEVQESNIKIDPKKGALTSYRVMQERLSALQLKNQTDTQAQSILPTFGPFVQINSAGADVEAGEAFSDLPESENFSYAAGVQFTWEFGNGRGHALEDSLIDKRAAQELRYNLAIRETRSQLLELRRQMESYTELLKILARQKEVSRERLKIEVSRYEIGRARALNITTAYQDIQSVEVQEPVILGSWYKAKWRAKSIAGQLIRDVSGDRQTEGL